MIVLGIETSSEVCSVGLANEHGMQGVLSIDAGSIHSEKLLTLVQSLLEKNRVNLSAIDGFAVSSGPGSFTGLRIGFSAAKGLCTALGKPMTIVPTPESLAASAAEAQAGAGNIVVALDAKKGDFYVTFFRINKENVVQIGVTELVTLGDLPGRLRHSPDLLVITDAGERIGDAVHHSARIQPVRQLYRGDRIAALGLQRFLIGDVVDVASAEPQYLKDFVVRKPSVV